MKPTLEQYLEKFDREYEVDVDSGIIVRKDTGNVLRVTDGQYHVVHVKLGKSKKKLYAHRLVFRKKHGYMPELIDHIDGDKLRI